MNDTIAAISSPFGEGAIALLRISGVRSLEIADAIFRSPQKPSQLTARTLQFGEIVDGEAKLDTALLAVFLGPASYTGDDVVEISCHGGILVSRRILELIFSKGARAAEPGEFTQRAFLNGKMDLTQAEAVMDLIHAQTDLALRAANEQLEGRLGGQVRALQATLLDLLAHIEAYIDFPDEDISPDTGTAMLERMNAVESQITKLLDTATHGRILREGLRTVICGAPNVGKSSLLNLLVGFDRAIVNARPGTTRDVLEEVINLRGIPLRLIDTAGLRETEDDIEQEGIERTHQQLSRADLVLEVIDGSASGDANTESEISGETPATTKILILNKVDLGLHADRQKISGIKMSAVKGEGLDDLIAEITKIATSGKAAHRDWSVAINARHQSCLQRAQQFLTAAKTAFSAKQPPEFVAEELRAALTAVGEVVGRVDTEDLLGVIFSQFCIGK